MVSVSGIDVKFGRILAFIVIVVGLIVLYRRYGTGGGNIIEQPQQGDEASKPGGSADESDAAKGLQPQEVVTEVQSNQCTLTYLEVKPDTPDATKPKLLLLHGAAFTAKTWDDKVGTMAKLKDWGYRAVAVDLKPESSIEKCSGDNKARGELIHRLVEKLQLSKVVLISPSLSGQFSIPYIMESSYRDEIGAYIPIAPVIDEAYKDKDDDFKALQLKVLIVQGADDTTPQAESHNLLSNMPNSNYVPIEGATHACYIDKPDAWHTELKKFLDSLSSTP